MTIRFDDKVAIVTGAGGGIGKEHALELARRGAKVVVNDLGGSVDGSGASDAANEVVDIIKSEGGEAISNGASVTDLQAVKAMVNQTMDEWGRIDILVNNAGIASGGLFQMTPISELRKVFEINFFSQILFTQGIAKIMIRNKSGSIINLSSSAAFIADPGTLSYGSSKSALIRATESMAMELGALNIRVNAIAPGVTKTDMFDQMSKDARDKLINSSSLKRPAEPKDIANVALFLASELSSFVTGQVIRADGGIT